MHGLSIGGRHVSAEVTARTEEEALGIFSSSLAYSIKPPTLTISRPPCASPGTRLRTLHGYSDADYLWVIERSAGRLHVGPCHVQVCWTCLLGFETSWCEEPRRSLGVMSTLSAARRIQVRWAAGPVSPSNSEALQFYLSSRILDEVRNRGFDGLLEQMHCLVTISSNHGILAEIEIDLAVLLPVLLRV